MSARQKTAVRAFITRYKDMITEFHHGDCEGADAEAHDIVAEILGVDKIWIHPPTDTKYRAYKESPHILKDAGYLVRDRHIVNVSTILLAAPKTDKEELRSGTWTTVRYARASARKVIDIVLER